ncbi:MAG: DUF167 domain-containing protein [Holosporales bacterium]|nr:DUF167 domain-containing protein [Holosporales bacterium]
MILYCTIVRLSKSEEDAISQNKLDHATALFEAFRDGTLAVRVTPRAGAERIGISEDGLVKIYVTVPPESGKANARVIELIAKTLGVAKSTVEITRGEKSRNKVIRLKK